MSHNNGNKTVVTRTNNNNNNNNNDSSMLLLLSKTTTKTKSSSSSCLHSSREYIIYFGCIIVLWFANVTYTMHSQLEQIRVYNGNNNNDNNNNDNNVVQVQVNTKDTNNNQAESSYLSYSIAKRLQNHAIPSSTMLWKKNNSEQVVKTDKFGNVVHHAITKLKLTDLKQEEERKDDNINNYNTNTTTINDAIQGRERLIDLLHDAGVENIDIDAIQQLPKWNDIANLYYTSITVDNDNNNNNNIDMTHIGPVIIGLETCKQFRTNIPTNDASIGVAGLFNTGTNPMAMYLAANCIMPYNSKDRSHGIRWQVPWGKHVIESLKWNNTAKHDNKVNKTNVLPVVLIRDPLTWMQSMCKHPYAAHWKHTEHCPDIIDENNGQSVPVSISYPVKTIQWDSIIELWSDWYTQYLHAGRNYPRLIVRFEDMIYKPKDVINEVCTCAGAKPVDDSFHYVVDAGKWGSKVHEGSSNMITAMTKYGNPIQRIQHITKQDIEYIQNHINTELMELFQYHIPSL